MMGQNDGRGRETKLQEGREMKLREGRETKLREGRETKKRERKRGPRDVNDVSWAVGKFFLILISFFHD